MYISYKFAEKVGTKEAIDSLTEKNKTRTCGGKIPAHLTKTVKNKSASNVESQKNKWKNSARAQPKH